MHDEWNAALEGMRLALEVMDKAHGPLDVGAHLDLAISRLEEALNVQTGAPGAGDYRDAGETLAQ